MKLSDELYLLHVPMPIGDQVMTLSLIVEPGFGLTLVDTGLPGQADLVAESIHNEGFELGDVKQIVITHQDIDHVGSLNPLKERTGATVFAHGNEISFIDGTVPPIKLPPPERLAQFPEMAERVRQLRPTPVDQVLGEGKTIPNAAGAIVVETPGHTPGHISLYLPRTKTLIAGDVLVIEEGILSPPPERATPDMPLALRSIQRLRDFDIETLVCYHGGPVSADIERQLAGLSANVT